MMFIVLVLTLPFAVVTAEHLPSYITACSGSDPEFINCILKQSKEVMPFLLKGVKEFNIPVLTPLKVLEVYVNSGPNLQLKFRDVLINGLDTATLTDCSLDLVNYDITANIYIENLVLTGTYEIDGHMQILPIKGNGHFSLNLTGANFDTSYKNEVTKKNGVDFGHVYDMTLIATTKNAVIHFDNLFNGDTILGAEMNKYLNENWGDVEKDIMPSVSEVIKTQFMGLLNGFLDKVPYDEIILP